MTTHTGFSISGCRKQRTLKHPVSFSGIGVHTGREVTMRFLPAPENTGIYFKRVDLPDQPVIPAKVQYVCDTQRSTTLGIGSIRIHTVEHVLAALRAFNIDNLCIEISNIEPPIGDGSSKVFVEMIEEAEIFEQTAEQQIRKLLQPIYWMDENIQVVALPYEGFRISYTLNYPSSTLLKAQFHSIVLNSDSFCKEVASCRTFSLYEEVEVMIDRGLIKGGSLDNAVVIQRNPEQQDVVFSKEGLRFPDEMVRHKVLDLVGDLSLVGFPFDAHILAIRAGHTSNFQLAKKIYSLCTEDPHV